MGFTTKISCDECGSESSFKDTELIDAKEEYFAKGGSETTEAGIILCSVCTWQHRVNHFAIDVDLHGNKDYQVLAVSRDKGCFSNVKIFFGRLDSDSDIAIRRITQPQYETLIAFGIPCVGTRNNTYYDRGRSDSPLFYNDPNDYKSRDLEEDQPRQIKRYDKSCEVVLDLSGAIEDLFAEKLPKAETPKSITDDWD